MPINPVHPPTHSPSADHTFLMNDGRWQLRGHWLMHRDGICVPVQGKLMVAWNSDDWFSLVGKISRPSLLKESGDKTDITLQYKGRTTAATQQQYTFVLQHSQYGQTEGEGWLMPDAIVQRFWILGDQEQRIGIERFSRISEDHYTWSSSIMAGHSLISTVEASLNRYR